MIEGNSNHCQIVRDSIVGNREVDEQTYASLTILTERLERLKNLDENFGDVEFSSAVKKLKVRKNAVAVG
ncbi:MAG: hypothetical protein AMJ75_06445 [Phycisphaerae bacterium SM1_79]|nr:MAG: hypothetical protein AMJ75_06445 [Phycisphaerae bacterium SM1_79]